MKKTKEKRLKNKKVLALGISGIAIIAIGATFAINHDWTSFTHSVQLAGFKTVFTETFDSPSNWKTCDTTPKTVTIKNDDDSDIPLTARVLLEEQWLDKDGQELPLVSANTGRTMAIINYTPNSGWTKRGDYYYYDTDLAKGDTTTSPIASVTLNCDANLSTTMPNTDGAYADATYHLKVTAQVIASTQKSAWSEPIADVIKSKANDLGGYMIDFAKKSVVSDDVATANGNGVNEYTENGQPVYYYRGEVNDNNVIWADMCWQILRTTSTGGTKMIYNGEPTTVNGARQCLATGADRHISLLSNGVSTNKFNYSYGSYYESPADLGYMAGTRIVPRTVAITTSNRIYYSNKVSRNGDTYTLDTSSGQSISGGWASMYSSAATRYHYFCTNRSTSCSSSQIGYLLYFDGASPMRYLPIGGYDDIEDAKAAMFANTNDSKAKSTVESWFEQKGLTSLEGDLEDAVFCNDRTIGEGGLAGESENAHTYSYNYFSPYTRRSAPSLSCTRKEDAFTKTETSTTNGKLKHKVGLITMDELNLAGMGPNIYDATETFLYDADSQEWTMSPLSFEAGTYSVTAKEGFWYSMTHGDNAGNSKGLRPVVSIKYGKKFAGGGTGTKEDPFVIE